MQNSEKMTDKLTPLTKSIKSLLILIIFLGTITSTAFQVFNSSTQKNWKASDRLTNSFKQKLYPLYDLFIEKLKLSNLFQTDLNIDIQHTKADRYFWSAIGAKEQNSIASLLDAIDINNLNLTLNEQTNC